MHKKIAKKVGKMVEKAEKSAKTMALKKKC